VSEGAAPLAVLALVLPLATLAFASNDPLVLAATLVASAAALRWSRAPWRLFAGVAAVTAIGVAVLNPFVASEGDLILLNGPHTVLLDLQVTLEELCYGAAAGVRVAAVTLACGAFLGLVDRDRALAGAARLAPRSAMAAALGARLLPVLRRDATTIGEAARLRGMETGASRAALRTWGRLLVPLTASALERGLDRAEAMTARGYGSTRPTRLPERSLRAAERASLLAGAGLATLAVAVIAGAGPFRYYPTLSAPTAGAGIVAAATAVLGVAGAWLLRGERA
jgi:energy-coupling factor transport system permease protein